ncbi:MAG: ABC-2 transporter permease [Candidatus Izemoplasmatales bacterium]|nr:ABC-2 transporter permease [Candidatus Izemoplasmatales bacterium]
MKNLVYKEIKLSIHRFYFLLPILLGLLMFIPNWIFTLVFMYFFWITAPQLYASYNAQQDGAFLMMLPISKKEYVKAKIMSLYILEGFHIFFGFLFGIIHNLIYGSFNWFFDINFAFFGLVLVLFSVFNLVFLPMYFKTGYYFGKPVIIAIVSTMIFAFLMEYSVFQYPWVQNFLEGNWIDQGIIVFISVVLTIIMNWVSMQRSIWKYERSS